MLHRLAWLHASGLAKIDIKYRHILMRLKTTKHDTKACPSIDLSDISKTCANTKKILLTNSYIKLSFYKSYKLTDDQGNSKSTSCCFTNFFEVRYKRWRSNDDDDGDDGSTIRMYANVYLVHSNTHVVQIPTSFRMFRILAMSDTASLPVILLLSSSSHSFGCLFGALNVVVIFLSKVTMRVISNLVDSGGPLGGNNSLCCLVLSICFFFSFMRRLVWF